MGVQFDQMYVVLMLLVCSLSLGGLSGCDPGAPRSTPTAGSSANPEGGVSVSGAGGAEGMLTGGVVSGGEGGAPYFEGEHYVKPKTHVNIVQRFQFLELEDEGVARGFDLDGVMSEEGDEQGCGHADFVSPEGREGVDNQLAELWATLAPLVGEQVHALLQNAVNEGRVLVMLELEGVDDLQNDDDVTLNVFRGVARPLVGTQGLISSDQTFEYDYESPTSSIGGLEIKDGELIAGPLELNIPITILSLDIIAKIEFGRVHLTLNEEGEMSGYLSGAMNVPELSEALINTDAEREARLVVPFFERNADMVPVDGVCTYISMGLAFEATRAYVVRDLAQE